MAITTNNSTYHDDYNTLDSNSPASTPNDKNYLRILFKPGYSVQVRELNQMQSMLQSQIDKFGSSVWKDNTAVYGGDTTFSNDVKYVVATYGGAATSLASTTYLTYTPAGGTGVIYADVLKYELISGTSYRFYVRYRSSSIVSSVNVSDFTGATTLGTNNSLALTLSSLGYACGIFMKAGIFFTKGSFVASPDQKYFFTSATESANNSVVGKAVLTVTESYVDSFTDITLLDNAANTPNYSAPGADRYVINLTLGFNVNDTVSVANISKILLLTIVNSVPTATVDERTSSLDTKLAQRTFEESGNYVLDPFTINIRELYDTGTNFGRFTTANLDKAGYGTTLLPGATGADFIADAKTRYSLEVDKSTAYVEGHRVVLNNKYDINATKARDESPSDLLTNTSAAIGNYVLGTFDSGSLLPNTTDITKRFNLNVLSVTKQATVTAGSLSIYILSGTAGLVVGMPVTVNGQSNTIASINAAANTIIVSTSTGSGGTVTTPILTFGSLATVPATCKIKTVELEGGSTYRIYLYDIQISTGVNANINDLNRLYLTADTFNFSISQPLSETASDTAIFALPYNAVKTVSGVKYIIRNISTGTITSGAGQTLIPISIPAGGSIVDTSPGATILNVGGTFVTPTSISTSGYVVASQSVGASYTAITPVLLDGTDDSGETAMTKTLTSANQSFNGSGISSTVNATALVAGTRYKILTVGSTDFTTFGAINSVVGTVFVATANGTGGSGTGTVTQGVTQFTLSQADVFKLTAVTVTPSGGSAINILSDCTISDDGQRSNYYTNVKVKYNGTRVFISTDTIAFTYSYLARGGAVLNGFATANSYNNNTNISGGLTYDTIPSFNGTRLSDVIDFRPVILSGTAATNSKQQIDPGSALLSKSIIYLPRIDKLLVGADASFTIKKGTPAISPAVPSTPANSMALYTMEIPAYTFNTADIKINYIDNRRYTMRDIGLLDNRITGLEAYTELSKLETIAQNKVITDILGSRFKNAVLTDGFTNNNVGDIFNAAYNCSIDPDEGIVRPAHTARRVDFKRFSSTGASGVTGIAIGNNIATLSYAEAELINQPYASSHESVNPYNISTFNGTIELSPNTDEWKDVATAALSNIVVNTGTYDDAVKDTIVGTLWNNWTTTWTGKRIVSKKDKGTKLFNPATNSIGTVRKTITTESVQKRTGTTTTLSYTDIVERKEDRIVDVSFIPFIRSRKVYFRAKLLKPNTRVYPFFDGIDISAFTMDTPFVPFKTTTLVRDYKGAIAGGLDFTPSSLLTNAYGEVEGMFLIPNNVALKFKVGSREFKLTDSSRNIEAEATTFAQADYTATGITESHETDIITTRIPNTQSIAVSESRNLVDIKRKWYDPLAQSFILSNISTGAFLTSVDLYFKQVSSTSPVTIQIVTMENGYPTQTVVPFSVVTKNPYATAGNTASTQYIFASDNSTVATNFAFSDPVYLKADTEYALVIISNDDAYRVWVADNNGFDVTSSPAKPINKNVYAGVFFKSQNGSTWSAEQTRDLKFKLNRAQFATSGNIVFKPVLDDGVSSIVVNAQTATVNTGFVAGTATVTLPMPAASGGANAAETSAYKRATATVTVDPATGAVIAVKVVYRGKGYGTSDDASWFNTNTVWTSNGSSVNTTLASNFTVNLDSAAITSFVVTQSNVNIPSTGIANVLSLGTGGNAIVSPIEAYENYDLKSVFTIDNASATNTTLTSTLTSTSNYVSPVIDLDRVSLLAIKNEVNNSVLAETTLNAGGGISRYVTKLVKLDKAANQLNVYMDVNRPSTAANIAVFVKLIYDGNETIPTIWTLVNPTNPIKLSSSLYDFSETEYVINSSANDFLSFAVKIVFLSDNTYDVVSLANLKVIATTGL